MSRAQVANGQDNPLLPLDTTGVLVSTASVTIRTLTLGKKQVTQSVFRQMPEAELVDTLAVKLTGIPWGWINYRWGDMHPNSTNFVFQQGGRLYRCNFTVRDATALQPGCNSNAWYSRFTEDLHEKLLACCYARILEGTWKPGVKTDCYGNPVNRHGWPVSLYSNEAPAKDWALSHHFLRLSKSYTCDTEDSFPASRKRNCPYKQYGRQDYADMYYFWNGDHSFKEACQAIRDWLEGEIRRRMGGMMSAEEILARVAEMEDRALDYDRRWNALMDQLRGVEQLFIAV